jgi:cytochrome P450
MDSTLDISELTGWGVYEIARRQDPYPIWDRMRAATPVLDVGENVFAVTSWELADKVLRDPSLLAGSGVAESMNKPVGEKLDPAAIWLMSLDGPNHLRARSLVRRPFSARQVESLRSLVGDQVKRLVESFLRKAKEQPTDFVSHVALALPSEVIRHLFHIDEALWAREVHAGFLPTANSTSSEQISALADFFQDVETDQGLFHDLQEADADGSRLSHDEMIANAVLLTMAAVDTTAGLISNSLLCLLEHGEILKQTIQAPSLIPEVVEETLRFQSPALSCSRFSPSAFQLGGVEIPAGSHILVCLGAANRDPDKYEDPNSFRLGRDFSGMITFGGGRHFCLGASLARMEARTVLEALLEVAPTLHLADAMEWRTDNPTVRIPRTLNISLRAEGNSR